MSRWARLLGEALRSLWGARAHAVLMMIGLVIGIAAVTVIYEIGEGVRERVVSMMANMGFGADAIYISSGSGRIGFRRPGAAARTLTPEDAAAVSRLGNVDLVVPQVMMRRDRVGARERRTSTVIIGVTTDFAASRRWEVIMGRFITAEEDQQRRRVAVLGSVTAAELFPRQNPLGQQILVGNVPMTVIGVLETKGGTTGSGRVRDDLILVPLSTAMRRLTKEDKLNAMRANLASVETLPETVEEVRQLLRARHKLAPGAPDDFTITTPETVVAMITRQSQAMVVMLTFISGVSLFVSGIVIMNIMLVAVNERAHEIGVRRAVGARRGDILVQFVMESVLVSLLGGALGLGLGLLLSWAATITLDVPTAFSPEGFALSFLFSAGVGLVFGLAPARKAAALSPVETLR